MRPGLEITKREETNITKEYEVVEKFLSAEEINYQNQSKFLRRVKVYDPVSDSQKIITLEEFSSEILPPDREAEDYFLGPGDIISMERSVSDLASSRDFDGDQYFSESLEIDYAGFIKTIDGLKFKVAGLTFQELENIIEPSLQSEKYLYKDQIVEKPFPLVVQESYRLGAGDVIQLTRLIENIDPESVGTRIQQPISYEVLVEEDGSIQFIELDGRIMLSDQTLEEAQDTIRQELLRSGLPTAVTVTLKQYTSHTISIMGDFGPRIVGLKPGFNTAGRVVLSYLANQEENKVGLIGENDDYLIKLFRGTDFFQLRLSTLLNSSDRDSYILLNGDRLEVVNIRETPKSSLK